MALAREMLRNLQDRGYPVDITAEDLYLDFELSGFSFDLSLLSDLPLLIIKKTI